MEQAQLGHGKLKMDKEQIIAKLKAGHELYNRGTGWWLSAAKRASCAADAVKVDDALMNTLERDGTLRIVMLTRSMRGGNCRTKEKKRHGKSNYRDRGPAERRAARPLRRRRPAHRHHDGVEHGRANAAIYLAQQMRAVGMDAPDLSGQ